MKQASKLNDEFAARAPWVTRFVIDGEAYGGQYDPYTDPRTDNFFKHFPQVERVLDMGSLEGAQSIRLAEHPTVKSVLGIEGRVANIERAKLIQRLYGAGKIRFAQANLEKVDLRKFGTFDAVFCAGVLYHMRRPWRLIEQIARVTDRLYIWTHHAPDDAPLTEQGYQGLLYAEFGLADAQSGLEARSFWLTFPSLLKMLADHGFTPIEVFEQYGPTVKGLVTSLSATKA